MTNRGAGDAADEDRHTLPRRRLLAAAAALTVAAVGEATLTTGFNGDKNIAGTGPLVLIILLGRCSGLRRQGATGLAQQLLALLVQANHRLVRIVGPSIQLQQTYMRRRYSAVSSPMHHISLHQGLRRFFLESGEWSPG